jgi:predicted nucleotidyltransferase
VKFVVVGAVAAVAAGAEVMTRDLDLLIEMSDPNLERILAACRELEAEYKDPAGRRFELTLERLRTFRLHLLRTNRGSLDLLREIGDGWRYEQLLSRSREIELVGQRVRVLDLEAVIESKQFANREKDRAVLPVLLEALRLRDLSRGSGGGE